MIAMNKKMSREFERTSMECKRIPHELQRLLAPGFFEVHGCYFLESLKGLSSTVSAADFPDKTGFECFVNSLHIDDFSEADYLAIALLFVEAAFEVWRNCSSNGVLQAIISQDEYGVLVKIHLSRLGESWLGDDLEAYEDAMFVADSTEKILQANN